jgi:hypothetical protein
MESAYDLPAKFLVGIGYYWGDDGVGGVGFGRSRNQTHEFGANFLLGGRPQPSRWRPVLAWEIGPRSIAAQSPTYTQLA